MASGYQEDERGLCSREQASEFDVPIVRLTATSGLESESARVRAGNRSDSQARSKAGAHRIRRRSRGRPVPVRAAASDFAIATVVAISA